MIRKHQHRPQHNSVLLPQLKENSHSLSTEESPRQNLATQPSRTIHKEKSQLCKKFVENGYCPY